MRQQEAGDSANYQNDARDILEREDLGKEFVAKEEHDGSQLTSLGGNDGVKVESILFGQSVYQERQLSPDSLNKTSSLTRHICTRCPRGRLTIRIDP